MKDRDKKKNIAVVLLMAFLFVFGFYIRQQIVVSCFHSTAMFFWAVNFGALLGLLLLYHANGLKHTLYDVKWLSLLLLPLMQMSFSLWPKYQSNTANFLATVIMLVCTAYMPISLVFLTHLTVSEQLTRWCLIFFNILETLLAIAACIDLLFERFLIRVLAEILSFNPIFTNHVIFGGDYTRFCSYLGHPLLNVALANMIYALNVSAKAKKQKGALPMWLSFGITLLLVATCSSKSGMAVFAGITVLAMLKEKYMVIIGVAGVGVGFISGIFGKLLERIQINSFSTGRFEAIVELVKRGDHPLHLFCGYGTLEDFYTIISSAAFEFPAVNLAYRYGILYPVMFLGLPLVYCIYRFASKRCFLELLLWLGLFAEMNTFDALGCNPLDYDFIFWFFSFLLIHMGDEKEEVKPC